MNKVASTLSHANNVISGVLAVVSPSEVVPPVEGYNEPRGPVADDFPHSLAKQPAAASPQLLGKPMCKRRVNGAVASPPLLGQPILERRVDGAAVTPPLLTTEPFLERRVNGAAASPPLLGEPLSERRVNEEQNRVVTDTSVSSTSSAAELMNGIDSDESPPQHLIGRKSVVEFEEFNEMKLLTECPSQVLIGNHRFVRNKITEGMNKDGDVLLTISMNCSNKKVEGINCTCTASLKQIKTDNGSLAFRFMAAAKDKNKTHVDKCQGCRGADDGEAVVDVRQETMDLFKEMVRTSLKSKKELAFEVFQIIKKNHPGKVLVTLSVTSLLRLFYHARNIAFGDWNGIVYSAPLLNVNGDQLFLQFDHSYHNTSRTEMLRMMGWAHPSLFQYLTEPARNIFIDCTFRIVPRQFHQLLIIMVYSKSLKIYIPVFYVLLQDKSEKTYKLAFKNILDALETRIDCETITTDYESGLINAAKLVFARKEEKTEFVLCLFHFKQALRRYLVKLKCKDEMIVKLLGGNTYLDDDEIAPPVVQNTEGNTAVSVKETNGTYQQGHIDTMTVIPPNEILTIGVPYIEHQFKDACPETKEKLKLFLKYFIATYVNGTYPIKYWNVHNLKLAYESGNTDCVVNRTNNGMESYNRILNNHFPTPHPPVPELVGVLRTLAEEKLFEIQQIVKNKWTHRGHKEVYFPAIPLSYQQFKQELTGATTETIHAEIDFCNGWDDAYVPVTQKGPKQRKKDVIKQVPPPEIFRNDIDNNSSKGGSCDATLKPAKKKARASSTTKNRSQSSNLKKNNAKVSPSNVQKVVGSSRVTKYINTSTRTTRQSNVKRTRKATEKAKAHRR